MRFQFWCIGYRINNSKLDHNQASHAMLMQSSMANNNLRNKSTTGLYGTIRDLQVPKVMVIKKNLLWGRIPDPPPEKAIISLDGFYERTF